MLKNLNNDFICVLLLHACMRVCARFLFIFKENEWRVFIQAEI